MLTRIKATGFCMFLSLFFLDSYCQKASIHIKLIDKTSFSPTDFVFEIAINNNGFENYWIQDTAFLKEELGNPGANLIYPFIYKKNQEGSYKLYENFKRRTGVGPPSKWQDSCINCIYLKKGESLTIHLKILQCCTIEKGQYRLQVEIRPPLFSCNNCDQLAGISSNYIYFDVNN
jgi:hypothetical protein